MIKPSELQILLTALSLAPLAIWAFRGIEVTGKPWIAAALAGVVGAHIATVAEGFVAPASFDALEHILYAVAGICFLVASIRMVRTSPSRNDAGGV